MYFSASVAVASVVALASMANAHMMLAIPAPYPGNQQGPIQDNPGGLFPCQHKMEGGTPTSIPLGSKNNKLSFLGTAVHGGGSCQISISYKKNPTSASDFRVITSFHGGCPIDKPGNMEPANAAAPLDSGLTFDVPSDIPGGDVILAWTWNNRIGNREFYMQCAPVKLTGTGGNKEGLEKLPTMVTPNMPGDCAAKENVDYAYENPGPTVRVGIKREFTKLTGCKGEKGSGGGGDKADPPKKPDDKPTPTPTTPTPTTPTCTTATVTVTVTVTAAPGATAAPSTNGGGDDGPCTDGEYKCDGKSFQQCSNKKWSAPTPLASGTSCKTGVSKTLFKRAVDRTHVRDFGQVEMV